MTAASTRSRRIDFEGSFNFRDLGGFTTDDERTTKWGRLYRADSVHLFTEADVARARQALGLKTLLDLRSDMEVEFTGLGLLAEDGTSRIHLPLTGEGGYTVVDGVQVTLSTGDRSPDTMVEISRAMLRASGPLLVQAVDALANDETLPAVFFCAAGKDRTGVLSATVLGALGVRDEDIIEDYVLTGETIDAVIGRFAANPNAPALYKDNPASYFTPYAETMERVLNHVREDYGSFAEYLLANGLEQSSLNALAVGLLETDARRS
jgi:protein-tyrosine phosphatase